MEPNPTTPDEFSKLIKKYVEGTCTEEECQWMDAWYNRLGSNDAMDEELTETVEMQAAGERLRVNITETVTPERRTRHLLIPWLRLGIAASILCFIAVAYYLAPSNPEQARYTAARASTKYVTVSNPTQTQKGIMLPDGSFVLISPGGTVRYRDDESAETREVYLSGEAYFDVVHDTLRPFFVYTGNMVTRVVGTSFVIRNPGGNDRITVQVETGKVSVYSRNNQHEQAFLTRHQEVSYNQLTDKLDGEPATQERTAITLPETSEMSFEETSVSEVFAALMNMYRVEIAFNKERLAACVLTSQFNQEKLHERIDIICAAIGATYTIADAKIIIESQGCEVKTSL